MSTIAPVAKTVRRSTRRRPTLIKNEPGLEQHLTTNDTFVMENIKAEINNTSVSVTSINKRSKTIKKTPVVKTPRATKTPKVPKAPKAPNTPKAPKARKPKREVESFATEEEARFLPAMRGRIERARREKMYIISRNTISHNEQEFEVTGSTGNLYTVSIGPRLSCACTDFRFRRRHCKHILMILLKLFHLSPSSPIFGTLAPNNSVLHEIFSNNVTDPSAFLPEELKTLIQKKLCGETDLPDIKTQRRPLESSDCPVCCDAFEEKALADILFCLVCGNNIHKTCFNMWKGAKGSSVTCVYCRSPWEDPNGSKKKVNLNINHEGYANFSKELGLSGVRDTTTYRDFPNRRY